MNLPHQFTASAEVEPTGNVSLTAENLPTLQSAPPVEFDGPGDQWSPEDLLVAAVADCFVLGFRAIASASKFEWSRLECTATGNLDKVERAVQFVELTVTATLTVPPDADETRAQKLLEKAEQTCFITNSLKANAHLETQIVRSG